MFYIFVFPQTCGCLNLDIIEPVEIKNEGELV